VLSLALGSIACLALVACATRTAAERHPAAVAVDGLLRLRRARSTDAAAYARYLEDSSVATQLAEGSTEASGPPLPKWNRPYVSAATTSTASVVVVWRGTSAFAEWPYATRFGMRRSGGRWRVVDAETLKRGDVPPPLR